MKYLFFLFLPFQFLIAQNSKNTGHIIYQVSLTEPFFYSDEFRRDYEEGYQRTLVRDSLMNAVELGVAFTKKSSQSFLLKEYDTITNNLDYGALYRVNGHTNYTYNVATKTATASMDYWDKLVSISVDLNSKWKIDFSKTKKIDGYTCYYATYTGKNLWYPVTGEPIYAWFTTDLPLPFGPLHYHGLPGLIIELNIENIRYTAKKIAFNDTYSSKLKPKKLSKHEVLTDEEFINTREDIKRRYKRIIIQGGN
ncbi:GLPGLI family protein [Oceanihabitans sediminis]|uniref:GLPGLI family protein n=1 Tax=Oceanihabitans sediminis TaxID=1812012 RepID=UPI00299E9413|nr:GLPGLI family protein [Oceanihabitans sediminis]MDX1772997.1 GLPGLI family protein [Oceanihabitans sediminis]